MHPNLDVPTSDPFLEALFGGEFGYLMIGAVSILALLLVRRFFRRIRPTDMDD